MNQQSLDLIKKIKELAERGIDGEKSSAQDKLQKLMEKYGITEQDLETEKRDWVKFWYKAAIEKKLMLQVLLTVSDHREYHESKTRNDLWFYLTAAENIEFQYKWEIYKKLFREESEIFYTAFVMKNRIFSIGPPTKSVNDLTPEEFEKWKRANSMSSSIKKANIYKQIDK